MPTDQSTAPATTTSRRTFLTRSLVGGALVTTGALAGSATGLFPGLPAGAQELGDEDFAAFAGPLELAAVQVYQAALDGEKLSAAWSSTVSTLQSHHQTVAATIATMADPDAPPAVAATDFAKPRITTISGAADEEAVLLALASLEDTLAATHLDALGSISDAVTARIVSQVLASESQAAAALGLGGGGSIAALTPGTVTTEGAVDPSDVPAPTTTTTAGD